MLGIVAEVWTTLVLWCHRTTSRRSRPDCDGHSMSALASICRPDTASWTISPLRISPTEPNKRCSVGQPANQYRCDTYKFFIHLLQTNIRRNLCPTVRWREDSIQRGALA